MSFRICFDVDVLLLNTPTGQHNTKSGVIAFQKIKKSQLTPNSKQHKRQPCRPQEGDEQFVQVWHEGVDGRDLDDWPQVRKRGRGGQKVHLREAETRTTTRTLEHSPAGLISAHSKITETTGKIKHLSQKTAHKSAIALWCNVLKHRNQISSVESVFIDGN